jgi:hypothetical protein
MKLLAVFVQHTDTKPEQQRIVCLAHSPASAASCGRPFLMLNDVGLTFGRANRTNANATGSVNLVATDPGLEERHRVHGESAQVTHRDAGQSCDR